MSVKFVFTHCNLFVNVNQLKSSLFILLIYLDTSENHYVVKIL